MPVTPEDLAKKAMEMPSESRARLADLLVESLDDAALNSIDRAWAEEAKRRLAEVREGKVKTIPGEEAFQQVRDSLKK
jgi:putative addiction module component (TIGR02574 family)